MTNIAIYPGSFDPITRGHLDIIQRAKCLFDHVIVGVIENPDKQSLFGIEERIGHINRLFEGDPQVVAEGFRGLLVDFAASKGVTKIIRGLRMVSDFDYEFQMAITNRKLSPQLDTIFLMTDEKYSYLSSSIVKQLSKYGADIQSFVTPDIELELKKRLSS